MGRRESTASQDTIMSLQQLDPSPIESPYDEKPLPDLPTPPTPSGSRLGLSGGGHSSVYYLTRLQKYSSYAFTIYATLHITNTSLLPLITRSLPQSESYLLLTRPYYQSFPLEPLLITLPLTTHILSGLILRINRRNEKLKHSGADSLPISKRLEKRLRIWPQMSWASLSGYVLTPLVLGHAFINRLLPWIYEGGSSSVGLGFVSHGFAKHPFLAWSGHVALVTTGVGHMVWGVARWNNWVPTKMDKKGKRRWWVINGVAAAVAGLWMAGGLGIIARAGEADGWVGKGYDELYSKVPLLNL